MELGDRSNGIAMSSVRKHPVCPRRPEVSWLYHVLTAHLGFQSAQRGPGMTKVISAGVEPSATVIR